jgi:DnaK suppressor protein
MDLAMTAQITRKSALPVDGIEPYVSSKDEEYMNEDQLAHFKIILQKWSESLVQEVNRTVGHMQEDASNFSDPADRATQEEEFTLELRARDRERKLIRKIEKTIARVDADDYGFCDACGIEIGLQRLEVRPTAELCIDCKATQEIKERQIAN